MVCDTYSRKLWTQPLRKKTATETLNAMKVIEKDISSFAEKAFRPKGEIKITIESIICDKGTEFGNNLFKNHFKNVKIFYKDPNVFNSSLSIIDRYCRTLRDLLNRYFTAYKTKKYINVLQQLTQNINNTISSTIQHTPNDIWQGKEINPQTPRYIQKLNIGDTVRIKNNPATFKRKNTFNYTNEIYTVESIDGLGYKLSGKVRKYFISELLKV